MFRNHKSKKNKTTKTKTKTKTPKTKTAKCHLFCKTDYIKHVNQDFKNEKQKKRILDDCKHIYCSDDCLKQYIRNNGFVDNVLVDNYKKRLNNNFLTDIDKRYNPKKVCRHSYKKRGVVFMFVSKQKLL